MAPIFENNLQVCLECGGMYYMDDVLDRGVCETCWSGDVTTPEPIKGVHLEDHCDKPDYDEEELRDQRDTR